MANGGYWRTDEERRRAEAPLLDLDATLAAFAAEFGLTITKNQKDWPERSIVWGTSIRYLMQLYLANEESLTFNLWLCASQDRDSRRFWKREFLMKEQPTSAFRDALPQLLREGRSRLEAVTEADLEFATNLGG